METVLGMFSLLEKSIGQISHFRNKDYDELSKFREQEKLFDKNTKLADKEALLKTVSFFNYLTWSEYEVIQKYDFGLLTIKLINSAKSGKLLYFCDDKIIVSNKKIAGRKFLNFENLFLLFGFIFCFIIFILANFSEKVNVLGVYFLMLLLLFLLLLFLFFNNHIRSCFILNDMSLLEKYMGIIEIDNNFHKK